MLEIMIAQQSALRISFIKQSHMIRPTRGAGFNLHARACVYVCILEYERN